MIVMNVVYAATAYPAGRAADAFGARGLLVAGLGVLVAADAALALATGPWGVVAGTAAWGVHLGLTQGLFSKLVADASPADLRGTAFGVYNLASGVAMLVASTTAGVVWHTLGARATFEVGGALALLAMVGVMTAVPRGERAGP
jgi:MFS family permease